MKIVYAYGGTRCTLTDESGVAWWYEPSNSSTLLSEQVLDNVAMPETKMAFVNACLPLGWSSNGLMQSTSSPGHAEQQHYVCGSCAAVLDVDAAFCPNCGAKLNLN